MILQSLLGDEVACAGLFFAFSDMTFKKVPGSR